MTIVSAMGQIFYSLSIAMGILITFGSYMKKEVSIKGSKENVEIFDTAILIMAGLMIVFSCILFFRWRYGNIKSWTILNVHHNP